MMRRLPGDSGIADACVTVTESPATAKVVLRSAAVLAVTEYVTTPLPVRLAPDVIVNQGTLSVAVQEQLLVVVTVRLLLLEPGPTFGFSGATT